MNRIRDDSYLSVAEEQPASETAAASSEAANAEDADADKKDRRKAGPWRLYVRRRNQEECKGTFLDNKLLSAEYHALNAKQMDELKVAGEAARVAPSEWSSCFGPTQRDVAKAQRKEAERNEMEAIKARLALAVQNGSPMNTRDLMLTEAVGNALAQPGASMSDMVRSARREMRRHAKVNLELAAAESNDVQTWEREVHDGSVRALNSVAPCASSMSSSLVIKSASEASITVEKALEAKPVVDMVHYLVNPSVASTTNYGSAFDADWEARHTMIQEPGDGEPEAGKTQRTGRPPCRELGICVCGAVTKQIWDMRNRFLAAAKAFFTKKSKPKEFLLDRMVVARLHATRLAPVDKWECAALVAAGRDASAVDSTTWWHIGAHCGSPYYFSYLQLLPDADPVDTLDAGDIALKVAAHSHIFQFCFGFQTSPHAHASGS